MESIIKLELSQILTLDKGTKKAVFKKPRPLSIIFSKK